MRDRYNRKIDYMRISLTDRCNFRCKYCMPEEGIHKISHDDIISIEEIVEIVKISSELGIKKIRLTGGEPLVRKGFLDLCKAIGSIEGIEEIGITTNGALLYPYLEELKTYGINRINLSLDTLNHHKYRDITRGHELENTLKALNRAYDMGFKIKVNTVLIGGFNTDEIRELVDITKDRDIQLRFIELMPIGESKNWDSSSFVSNDYVLENIKELVPTGSEGVASVYTIPGYSGSIGFISPISCSFCQDCNRIRLTSDGKLKPCLHSEEEYNVKGLSKSQLREKIKEVIYFKPESHHLEDGITDTHRFMNTIGG